MLIGAGTSGRRFARTSGRSGVRREVVAAFSEQGFRERPMRRDRAWRHDVGANSSARIA